MDKGKRSRKCSHSFIAKKMFTVYLQICTEWTILTRNAWMYPLQSQTFRERRAEVVVFITVLAADWQQKIYSPLRVTWPFHFHWWKWHREALVSNKGAMSCVCVKGPLSGQDPSSFYCFLVNFSHYFIFEIHKTGEIDRYSPGSYMPQITCIFVVYKFLS